MNEQLVKEGLINIMHNVVNIFDIYLFINCFYIIDVCAHFILEYIIICQISYYTKGTMYKINLPML